MTNQTDMYDQKEEDKMTRIMMTLWDEDCKKKMTDETGGWVCGGEYDYGAPEDFTRYDCMIRILYEEIDKAVEDGKFEGVDEEFVEYFICENSKLEKTMSNYMKLSDWRVSKAFVPFQALFRGREVRWRQRASKVAVVVQALVRGREVRWRYPLYALMS